MSGSDRKVKIYESRLAIAKAKVRLYQRGREWAKRFASMGMVDQQYENQFAEVIPLATDEMMKIIQLGKEGGDMPTVEKLPDFFHEFFVAINTAIEHYLKNSSLRLEDVKIARKAYEAFVGFAKFYSECSTKYMECKNANVK